MMLLESPSPIAPVAEWHQWLKRLNALKRSDKTVIAEKRRAREIIALLEADEVDVVQPVA